MSEFIVNQGRQVQYIPIAGGISLVSPPKVRIAGSSPYQQFGTPSQNITFSSQKKLVQQQQQFSPGFQVYNPLIKHLPVETERVGTINQSYINQPNKSLGNQLTDSRKPPKNNNDGLFLNNQLPPKSEFFATNTNSQYIQTGELQKFYGAPLVPAVSSSSSLVQQSYYPGSAEQQQQPHSSQKSHQKPIQKIQVNLNDSLSSQKKVLSSSEVILGTYATPVRKINEPLTLQQVQAKLREGSKERDKPVIATDKCKIFGEEFLEQRERDFLRRIENLEMQKNLLASQLKYKEDESTALAEQIAGIQAEKDQRELQLVEEIEKLNRVVENLTASNNQLRQGQQIAQQEQQNVNQQLYGRQLQQTYQQVQYQ